MSSHVPSTSTQKQYTNPQDLVAALRGGVKSAYDVVYELLNNLLSRYYGTLDRKKLAREDTDTPEGLLARLFERGKIRMEKLDAVDDPLKWLRRVANNELLDIVCEDRNKSKHNFISRCRSYDAPIKNDQDSETPLVDILAESIEEDISIPANTKIDMVEQYIEDQQLDIDDRYLSIFLGRKTGKSKSEIMPIFKSISMKTTVSYKNNDEKAWSGRYDLVFHRGSKLLNELIPYKELISSR